MVGAWQHPWESVQQSVFYTRFRGLKFLEEILVDLTILEVTREKAKSFIYIELPCSEKSQNEGVI